MTLETALLTPSASNTTLEKLLLRTALTQYIWHGNLRGSSSKIRRIADRLMEKLDTDMPEDIHAS